VSYSAYVISEESRAEILRRFPPRFGDVICHHVTVRFGVPASAKWLPQAAALLVLGHVNDDSLEALIVSVNGTTTRPDGQTYHITLSLDRSKGRKPVDANGLIASAGWRSVEPFAIDAAPRLC
jgi:hypothetical protein